MHNPSIDNLLLIYIIDNRKGGCRLRIIGVMRFMKKLNYYDGEMFIDKVEGNKIVHRHLIKDAHFVIVAHSLHECLQILLDKCHTIFGYDIMIGIPSIWCNDKHIDWNYKNRVIYNHEKLKEYMWC